MRNQTSQVRQRLAAIAPRSNSAVPARRARASRAKVVIRALTLVLAGALCATFSLPVAAENAATVPESTRAQPLAVQALIVNGQATSGYPSVGALLLYADATASSFYGACSGILIGCRTFLTAAHCVCPDNASDAATCEREGKSDPSTLRVFLQAAGIVPVADVAIAPNYTFAVGGDVAVITLATPVTGVAPSALNTAHRPEIGTAATIVGYGTTATGRGSTDDSGLKRMGTVTTAACPTDIPSEAHICWEFGGSGANSCEGDSGGPLFVDFGGGMVLAGVTSGGHSFNCLAPDSAFDADVFVNRAWIADTAGTDLGTESCDLPAVGTALTTTSLSDGDLSSAGSEARAQFEVPDGTAVLRIALNAQIGSGSGFASELNDFDLFARAGSAPTTQVFDCADTNPTPFGSCEITAPRSGTWHVLIRRNLGAGAYQVAATMFAAAAALPCTGDCNGDGAVTVDEMVTGVAVVLGSADLGVCNALDANGDGMVTVDEIVAAVTYALNGCPRP